MKLSQAIKCGVFISKTRFFSLSMHRGMGYHFHFIIVVFRVYAFILVDRAMARKILKEYARLCQLWPVYGLCWSRDCDMVESTYVQRFPTYWHLDKARWEHKRQAEGPSSIVQISRRYAKDFEPTTRDRIAEAWDNGNTSPYIV